MADDVTTPTHTMEKIYCMPCMGGNDNHNTQLLAELMNAKNQGTDAATMAALFSKNNQNAWDNPFIWLIWLAWMGNGGFFGGNRADVAQNADLSRQMSVMQGTITDNHNNDLALNAINGNRDALGQLAQTFNTDITAIQGAIASVKSAIDQVGGTVGYTSESIKNAIALGDRDIIQQMCNCCCQNKELVQRMGYENQLANERQTNILTSQMAAQHSADQLQNCQNHGSLISRIDQLANGIQTGFANLGYQNEKNTSAVIQNATANTQRILDQMCANTTQSLRDQIADKDRQLQTQTIIASMNNGCGCCSCN